MSDDMTDQTQTYQQRVIEEKTLLDSKIARLTTFVESEFMQSLGIEDQVDLRVQLVQMTAYHETLGRRISRFSGKPTEPVGTVYMHSGKGGKGGY